MLEGLDQAVDLAGHLTLPYRSPAKPSGPGIFSFTAAALPAHRPGGRNRPLYLPDGIGKGRPGSVRLQFTDPETGEVKISDEFEVSAIEQNRTYSMTIYSGRGGSGPRKGGVQRYSRTFRRDIYLPGQD